MSKEVEKCTEYMTNIVDADVADMHTHTNTHIHIPMNTAMITNIITIMTMNADVDTITLMNTNVAADMIMITTMNADVDMTTDMITNIMKDAAVAADAADMNSQMKM